jgi:hypothetical protein
MSRLKRVVSLLVNDKLERISKEAAVAYSRYCFGYLLGKTKDDHESLPG